MILISNLYIFYVYVLKGWDPMPEVDITFNFEHGEVYESEGKFHFSRAIDGETILFRLLGGKWTKNVTRKGVLLCHYYSVTKTLLKLLHDSYSRSLKRLF